MSVPEHQTYQSSVWFLRFLIEIVFLCILKRKKLKHMTKLSLSQKDQKKKKIKNQELSTSIPKGI